MKVFQDAEFKVVDVIEGVGKMAGCAVFVCKTVQEKTFNTAMKATMEERRKMYTERKKYIGKQLTVRFFEWTDDQIPRFPLGVCFRGYKDL